MATFIRWPARNKCHRNCTSSIACNTNEKSASIQSAGRCAPAAGETIPNRTMVMTNAVASDASSIEAEIMGRWW